MALTVNAVTIDVQDRINGVHRYDGTGTSWTQIRGAVTVGETVGGGWGIVVGGTGGETGQVLGYSGTPFDWFSMGERGATYAVSHETVYKTTPDGSQVLQFDGFEDSTPLWSKVGGSASLAVAGSVGVVAQMPDLQGDTFLYTGNPDDWENIGPGGNSYAIADTIYRSHPLGTKVFKYKGTGTSWDDIGGPPGGVARLFGGGFGLFATALDASGVFRYRGTPGNWDRIGEQTGSCAVADDTVYRVGGDGSVFRYNGSGDSWSSIGRPDRVFSILVASD
ncbi:hypothetical protein [Streptomyces agglomeratus]|uniref:hypothetical protein n=1 Tax=Streptomyces agglomeratus TaxID=285458 RepID=UPI000A48750C|nr:hypothetical protein [Streptomyces agglomeratus]